MKHPLMNWLLGREEEEQEPQKKWYLPHGFTYTPHRSVSEEQKQQLFQAWQALKPLIEKVDGEDKGALSNAIRMIREVGGLDLWHDDVTRWYHITNNRGTEIVTSEKKCADIYLDNPDYTITVKPHP